MIAIVRLSWRRFWGRVVNLAGLPGFVREVDYASGLGVSVRVRTFSLFTVVTVNGVDVFFYRLTGRVDGIGFSPASDCIAGRATELADLGALPGSLRHTVRTRSSLHPDV